MSRDSRNFGPAEVHDIGAAPVELVDPDTGDPKLFFFAPAGVKVQFNRATESPPPVQVTYPPEAPRAIPYRLAVPLAIIVFAAGAVLVLLVSRNHASSAVLPNDVASTRDDDKGSPRQHASTGLAASPAQVASIEPGPVRAFATHTVREEAALPVAATGAASAPVILMDIPANDSMAAATSKSTRGDEKTSERKTNRSKMHYDDPD